MSKRLVLYFCVLVRALFFVLVILDADTGAGFCVNAYTGAGFCAGSREAAPNGFPHCSLDVPDNFLRMTTKRASYDNCLPIPDALFLEEKLP